MDKKAYFDKTCWKRLVDRLSNQTFCLHLLIEVTSNVNPLEADEESLRGIELDLHDFCEAVQLTGVNRYQIVKKAIKKIIETAIDFKEDRRWRAIPFFNPKETSIIDKSRMSITINSEFIPYLADLKKFLVIKKDDICLSNRCLIFFTYLKTDCFNSTIKKPWEEVQSACGVCYDNYHDFKRKFLAPVVKEMLGKKIKVTYEAHKTGSKVNTLSFTVEDLREQSIVEEEKKLTPPKKENPEVREIFNIYLKLYPKKGAYKFRQEKIERAIKDYDFETIKAIIEWFPSNTWWNEKSKVDLYENIIAPTRIDGWISEMSVKPKFKAEEKKVNTTPRNISDAEMNFLE